MAASGRPPRSACLAEPENARASLCRQRLEMAPPPLFLFVHRTLIFLQPQDEIATTAQFVARFVRRLRFMSVFIYRSRSRASGSISRSGPLSGMRQVSGDG